MKNIKCIRIDQKSYEIIKKEVISKLSKYIKIESLIELPEKDSYGDLDLLYENNTENILDIVKTEFNPKDIMINGPYISFSYYLQEDEYFQIDLINVDNLEIAKFYMSYGDLGSIIGLIVKKNNLSFGHVGLSVIYEDEKIILLNEPKKICNFLNLDYNKYKNGFNSKEEIFKWILDCKYFKKEYFDVNKFNGDNRKRYLIRPFFNDFCKYVYTLENISNNSEDNELSVNEYINLFEKNKEKDEIDKKIEIRKLYQEKYSGLLFMEYLEDKKNINKYKEQFKEKISLNYNFNEWLKNNDIEYIKLRVKEFIDKP